MPVPPGHRGALAFFLAAVVQLLSGCRAEEVDTATRVDELAPDGPDTGITYTDQFTETAATCDWAAYRAEWFGTEYYGNSVEGPFSAEVPSYPSEACIDRVLADFKVDIEAFLAVDGLADPYDAVETDIRISARLGAVLAVGRGLMLFDYGSVDELQAGGLVSPAFGRDMEAVAAATGVESLAAAQYNYVTSIIRGVIVGEGTALAEFWRARREVQINAPWGLFNAEAVAIMMHEARHVDPSTNHVPCDNEAYESQCDEDLHRASGYELASLIAARDGYEDHTIRRLIRSQGWNTLVYVNVCTDDDGRMLSECQAVVDQAFPGE